MKEKKYQKYLKQKSWYHATTVEGLKSILKHGVKADYNYGNELDYGYGFYLTPTYKQAESYIKRNLPYIQVSNEEDRKGIVIEFELCLNDIMDRYNYYSFLHFNQEFADFVIKNRLYKFEMQHHYDFIIGVMTDSNPYSLISDYKDKIIDYHQLTNGLLKWNSMEQLSLHNQEICDILKLQKAINVDTGKEMDFSE